MIFRNGVSLKCEWRLNIRTACFVAALAQILWSLLIIIPQAFGSSGMPGLDWTSGLMLFESLALVIFFTAAYWEHERMNRSIKVGYAAFIAAVCLGIENLGSTYETFRFVGSTLGDSLFREYRPFIRARHILGSAIPSLAVVSLVIFLLVVWYTSPRSSGASTPVGNGRRGHNALGVAALLAFMASVVAIGQLLLAVTGNPVWQRPGFSRRFSLRLLSLGSLAVFFLLLKQSQRPSPVRPSQLTESKSDKSPNRKSSAQTYMDG